MTFICLCRIIARPFRCYCVSTYNILSHKSKTLLCLPLLHCCICRLNVVIYFFCFEHLNKINNLSNRVAYYYNLFTEGGLMFSKRTATETKNYNLYKTTWHIVEPSELRQAKIKLNSSVCIHWSYTECAKHRVEC